MSRSVKGLMVKDFQLMKSQMKLFFIVLTVWGVIMASSRNMTFFVGYSALLCSFMLISTFSYDAFENGNAYLFTLPVSRRDYIFEKFVLGFLLATVPFLLSSAVSWVVLVINRSGMHFGEYCLSVAPALPLAYLLLAVEIPLQVKFGQEKSRIVSFLMIGGISVAMGMAGVLTEQVGVDGARVISNIAGLGIGGVIALAVVILLVLLSYRISCRIIEKKEF